jgi:hypothetical protein
MFMSALTKIIHSFVHLEDEQLIDFTAVIDV